MIRLKLWRVQNKLTQAEAAVTLGLGESSLAMLESGRVQATAGQYERLRRYFGSQVDSLFEQVSERVKTPLE